MKRAQPRKFHFYGGHLALDFVNTVEWRKSRTRASDDYLQSYDDLLGWSRQAGLLSPSLESALRSAAREAPRRAARVLEQAVGFREVLYRMFILSKQERPRRKDMDRLNDYIHRWAGESSLRWTRDGFEWGRSAGKGDLAAMLGPVLRAAVELLTSEERTAVSQCQDDRGCGWLFLDKSRGRPRRWCSMQLCGNRAKAKRHYSRSTGRRQ